MASELNLNFLVLYLMFSMLISVVDQLEPMIFLGAFLCVSVCMCGVLYMHMEARSQTWICSSWASAFKKIIVFF